MNGDEMLTDDRIEELEEILEQDLTTYRGTLPVTELDLYFYLLVYASCPLSKMKFILSK